MHRVFRDRDLTTRTTAASQLMRSIAGDAEDSTEVVLLDSNSRRDMIIMRETLDSIVAASGGRMAVHYYTTDASDPAAPLEVSPPSFSHEGRIDRQAMQAVAFPVRPLRALRVHSCACAGWDLLRPHSSAHVHAVPAACGMRMVAARSRDHGVPVRPASLPGRA